MSITTEKKRKRTAEDADSTVRPPKTRVVENLTQGDTAQGIKKKSSTIGLSRQEKSERRSKKTKRAAEKKYREPKLKDSSKVVEDSTSANTTHDALANSADFVALEPSASVEKPSKKAKSKESSKDQTIIPSADATKKDNRFIVFVGNLPYTATKAQIENHFAKIGSGIKAIRLNSDKQTGRGKGFAFLEFDGFEKMKTCLKLYHHSIFDPESSAEDKEAKDGQKETGKGRRINVELTAGGGGKKSDFRRDKIGAKNRKLDEEREKTRIKEKQLADKESKKTSTGANGMKVEEEKNDGRGAVHPSRLSRVAR